MSFIICCTFHNLLKCVMAAQESSCTNVHRLSASINGAVFTCSLRVDSEHMRVYGIVVQLSGLSRRVFARLVQDRETSLAICFLIQNRVWPCLLVSERALKTRLVELLARTIRVAFIAQYVLTMDMIFSPSRDIVFRHRMDLKGCLDDE
jgi:hypothetical protein